MSDRLVPSFRALAMAAAPLLVGLSLITAAPVPAAAQNDLSREVEILKRDLRDLQRYIYRGEGQPPAPPSDAGAASSQSQSQGEAMPSDVAGRLQVKMQRLEREMRDLTGRVEQAEFRTRQLDQRLETLSSDIEFRLQRLEQQVGLSVQTGDAGRATGGASAASGASSTAPSGGDAQGTTVISSAGATQENGAGAPQTLGSLRTNAQGEVVGAEISPQQQTEAGASQSTQQQAAAPSSPQAPPQPGAVSDAQSTASAPSGALPEGSAQEQYDYAFSLLRSRDFAAAEQAMRSFVDAHGDNPLAGNAMYWLGETYYARENYRDAAATFLDAYTGYPQNDKASHSLLKLAMSLGALGKKDAACQAFSTLAQDGAASERILSTGRSEAQKLGCP